MTSPADPSPDDFRPGVNTWMLVEDRIRQGKYDLAIATLARLRSTTTDAEGLAYIEERLAYIVDLQARPQATSASQHAKGGTASGGSLAIWLSMAIIATAVLLARGVLHESTWWAVIAVAVLALPVLVVANTTLWATLSGALPPVLHLVIPLSSAGYLVGVTFRFGIWSTLACVGGYAVGLCFWAYPVWLIFTARRFDEGRYDHL